jgi:hypothetical protein
MVHNSDDAPEEIDRERDDSFDETGRRLRREDRATCVNVDHGALPKYERLVPNTTPVE